MFYQSFDAQSLARIPYLRKRIVALLVLSFVLTVGVSSGAAVQQSIERELNTPERVEVRIRNRSGRVTVIAADEHKKVTLRAETRGATIAEKDVRSAVEGNRAEIDVERGGLNVDNSRSGGTVRNNDAAATGRRSRDASSAERERIDITLRVPARARVSVETEEGAVDVVGNVESAEVATNTGTIRADVPLDALKYNFQWRASRPRFYSEVELSKVKEKRGGIYEIAGRFGDKKAKKETRIEIRLVTERGVVLFGVADASMVPTDLRERALTESARAIIRSGDSLLIDAIRKTAPRLVGDYAETLPARIKGPELISRRREGGVATSVEESVARVNASVTDRNGRAIGGLTEKDFALFENGQERQVQSVLPTSAPFNLVLLLDVSGSVEERLDFIRKAALAFLNTVGAQDRIAIISFRDDVQLISEFTTDRALLGQRIKKIDAGGGTALYDSLAYTLAHTLRPLRGERAAVVILSDGDDNKSFIPFNTLLEAVLESGALIYPLYIPSGLIPSNAAAAPSDTNAPDPFRTRFLSVTSRANEEGRKLASLSGGVYYPITRLDQLQQAYNDVVTQLRMAYTITYASKAADTRDARIRVRVAREDASVRLSPAVSVAPPTP
ncbi:MAG TPA: VWA domain-containing protein [Pyrinomonadaceae bacterium]|jgi:VWFA-related protein